MENKQTKKELQSITNPIKRHLEFLNELRVDLRKNKKWKRLHQKYSK